MTNIEIEIDSTTEKVTLKYIGLGHYADNQDGIFRYWPDGDSKSDFFTFLYESDLCIVLLTIGQQAYSREVSLSAHIKMDFINKLANKYFDEYKNGIVLNKSMFINWSMDMKAGGSVKEKLVDQNCYDNIFILKTKFDELNEDLKQYILLFK